MYPVKRYFLLIIIAALPLHGLFARTHSATDTQRPAAKTEYFANGNVKSVTVVKVKTPRNIDLFNFYKKTKIIRTEFDSLSGAKIAHSVRVTKVGVGGKHCYEYSSVQINYDENGKRKSYEKSKCDKNYYIRKDYVNGKVSFIHVEKGHRRWL
jgi:hypothetical protein